MLGFSEIGDLVKFAKDGVVLYGIVVEKTEENKLRVASTINPNTTYLVEGEEVLEVYQRKTGNSQ